MTRKKRRLYLIGSAFALFFVAAILVFRAMDDSMVFFYSPTDLVTKEVAEDRRIRIGGLVEAGSLQKEGETVRFNVTDVDNTVSVTYVGILPDLFREGQGIVAEGTFSKAGQFSADSVLAKHDENYMPPEVAEALKASGQWKEGDPVPGVEVKKGY